MKARVPLADLIVSAVPGFACGERSEDGVLQVRMNCVSTEGLLDMAGALRVPAPGNVNRVLLESGDVLFNSTNSPHLVGKTALFAGWPEPVTFSNHFLRLRGDPRRVDPAYLSRWLHSQWRGRVFEGMCTQWVNQASVRKERLLALKVPLPLLPEQRRIAAILDKADAIRRKRQASLAILDELLRSAYDRLVGPGATGHDSWPSYRIAELAQNQHGSLRTGPFGSGLRHSEFVDSGVAVLGIDNVVRNRFEWGERRYILPEKYEQLKRYTVFPGDVLVTIMGTVGRSAVVPDGIPVAISTKHLATITVDPKKVEPNFLSSAIHSDRRVLAQILAANRGAIMPGLNLGIIKELRISLPPLAAQRAFVEVVSGVEELRALAQAALDAATHLFLSLSQRAFRGALSER